ncbi:MAG: hypothetical protein KY433_00715 [Actinobacteria bacterium]|nr:hypothetical protein [Actinomycetota bacterium]
MAITLDEALLMLNDRLGQEVTAWVEVVHETPLLIATGLLENWSQERTGVAVEGAPSHFDLRGHYSIADARFDLSDAPVQSVSERSDGLTFRVEGGVRLVVTWQPKAEGDLV